VYAYLAHKAKLVRSGEEPGSRTAEEQQLQ